MRTDFLKETIKKCEKKILFIYVILAFVLVSVNPAATAYATSSEPDIVGTSAIIYCATTDEIIWQKNPHDELNPASITKLMTCLIAIEKLGIEGKVTVTSEAVQSAIRGNTKPIMTAGEELTVKDLVYECLFVSANDAAAALAVGVSGSEAEFAKLMNERASAIGCTHTNFQNASGIQVEEQYSCAFDVAQIAKEAFSNKELRKIAGELTYTVDATDKSQARDLENGNLFLSGGVVKYVNGTPVPNVAEVKKYLGVFGGKTGTTRDRKATMVVGCDFDGLEVYAVVMNSDVKNRYVDIEKELNYAKENLSSYEVFDKGQLFGKGKIKGGATNRIEGVAAEAGIVNLPEGVSASLFTAEAVYDENLTAPIKKGQKIGVIQIYMADDPVRTIDLLASKDIEEGWFLSPFGITNLQTIIIIAVLALTAVFFITVAALRVSNRRKRAAARKDKLRKLAMDEMEREYDYRQRNWPY